VNPTPDLIPPEAEALVGSEISRSSGVVSKKEFQRFAAAVGDRNPLYFDTSFARSHGFRDVIAPALYLPHAVKGVTDLSDLRPDGTPVDDAFGPIPLPGCTQRLAGGETWRFHAYVYDGDQITAIRRLTGIQQKLGRSGPFVIVAMHTNYLRGTDEIVAESVISLIAKP
jgi:acyl dehydratase